MTAKADIQIFDEQTGQPARRYDIPKLALRRRSDEHPMAMFGVIVATAFVSILMLQAQGPAHAAVNPIETEQSGAPLTTAKTERLAPSETDRICQGQAWGAESIDCLLMIAKENGKGEARNIRMVFANEINSSTPNVF